MATLKHIPLRTDTKACLDYITDPKKIVPPEDVVRLMTYMQSHSAEKAYSVGYNGCFGAKEIALQQFRACEQAYYRQHRRRSDSVLAHHFILSLPDGETADLPKIMERLMSLPKLKGFYGFGNVHMNTDNLHMHIVVSNFSKDGTRKLGMKMELLDYLRNELDHICVDFGLSIIDDPRLAHKFPERVEWIERLVRSGEVKVLLPNRTRRKQQTPHQQWMVMQYRVGRVGVCRNKPIRHKPDPTAQRMIDSFEIFRELNCHSPADLDRRIQEIGEAIGQNKKDIAYQRSVLSKPFSGGGIAEDTCKREKASQRLSALENKGSELGKLYYRAKRTSESLRLAQYNAELEAHRTLDELLANAAARTHPKQTATERKEPTR